MTEFKTEYQQENSLEKLFQQHQDQIDQLFEKYGEREKDKAVLYRFLKAFEFNMEDAEQSLVASLVR